MGNKALAHAVKDLALPEHVVRAVVDDYLNFLRERQPDRFASLDERMRVDPLTHDLVYFEAQASMLGATLILTMDASIDVASLLLDVYGEQTDPDLLSMRKELVSRAAQQAKDAATLAGLAPALVKSRKERFCSQAEAA